MIAKMSGGIILDLNKEVLYKLRHYTFQNGDDQFISYLHFGKKVILPANLSYFKKIFPKYTIQDDRVLPKLSEKVHTDYTLRENQLKVYNQLIKHENIVVAQETNFGKTFSSIMFGILLQTPMLFVASQLTYLENFVREVEKIVPNYTDYICQVDKNWDGTIKPFMYGSLQYCNKVVGKLRGKIGLLVSDEIHKAITSDKYGLFYYKINPKYRLWLSATYQHRAENYVNAFCSDVIVSSDSELENFINVIPLALTHGVPNTPHISDWHKFVKGLNSDKKAFENLAKAIFEIYSSTGRAFIINNSRNKIQQLMYDLLTDLGLRVAILNKDTQDEKTILEDFEKGLYDGLIGGTKIQASISLYRLSMFINTDVAFGKYEFGINTTLTQSSGRLKRYDEKIEPKSKILIDMYWEIHNGGKYRWDREKCYNSEKIYNKLDTIYVRDYNFDNLIKQVKEIS